jgi:glucose-1-phosphate cytidylyltransferase
MKVVLFCEYEGFWRAMDTLRDKQILEDMVEKGKMPWKIGARPEGKAQL